MPHSNAVTTVRAAVNSRIRASIPISCKRGSVGGASATSARDSHTASTKPRMLPTTARTADSASNCRISRPRPAPSALRTAISRSRPMARASIRLAMSAQAIRRTNPTAANATQSSVREPPADFIGERRRGAAEHLGQAAERRRIHLARIRPHEGACVGVRLRRCHASLQPRDDAVVVHAAERAPFARREPDWHVHIGGNVVHDRAALRKREAARHDADDREGLAIEQDRTVRSRPDHGRMSAPTARR